MPTILIIEDEIELTRVLSSYLEQIIGNLIFNALRFKHENSWVKMNLNCDNEQAVITIRDNGPGIPEEAQEQIFERFYRADQSRSRAAGGGGLGLAIAQQLAEAQDGHLSVRHHPEGGAEFQLSFPLMLKAING